MNSLILGAMKPSSSSVFADMKNYTFGAMSLGADVPASMDSDFAVARKALEASIWFHASPTYHRGMTFMMLRLTFDAVERRPKMILKIRDARPDLLRFEVEDACRRLGLNGIDVIQLVALDAGIVKDLKEQGPVDAEIRKLREEGRVKGVVLFLRPEHAGAARQVWPSGQVDGFTLYWNPLQRSCADEDWDFIEQNEIPVLALRTLAGGVPETREDARREAYLRLLRESGAADWTEFCLRYAASCPLIRTSIGGTSSVANLDRYLAFAENPPPLESGLVEEIDRLRRTGREEGWAG